MYNLMEFLKLVAFHAFDDESFVEEASTGQTKYHVNEMQNVSFTKVSR